MRIYCNFFVRISLSVNIKLLLFEALRFVELIVEKSNKDWNQKKLTNEKG
jgi:hypothetical protein